jgi:hypothetical protein
MNATLLNAYRNFVSAHDRTPGIVDASEARELISIAKDINKNGNWCCFTSSLRGDRSLITLVQKHTDHFESESLGLIRRHLNRTQPGR